MQLEVEDRGGSAAGYSRMNMEQQILATRGFESLGVAIQVATFLVMYVVTEADAVASQASRTTPRRGPSQARRRCQAARRGLPGASGRRRQMPLQDTFFAAADIGALSGGVLPRAAPAPFSTDARLQALHRHGHRRRGTPLVPKTNAAAIFDRRSE
jgi:hypothetical protein